MSHSSRRRSTFRVPVVSCAWLVIVAVLVPVAVVAGEAPEGWTTQSPREEVRPEFTYESKGGPRGNGSFVISADQRAGLIGMWTKTVPIEGGRYYRFSAQRRTTGIETPRRAAVARLLWRNPAGQAVRHDERSEASYRRGERPRAEPEFPADHPSQHEGWTEVRGEYLAPTEASHAVIELGYRWAADGRIEWADVELKEIEPPQPRKVRLASVHYKPVKGKTPAEKREQFAPLIEQAAEQKADLVVLPETLTYFGTGLKFADCAEPIPGPSTDYFGELARRHNLYIVAGLLERDQHLVYNVAALIGPDGKLLGKYRKVTLPRGEIEGGITPGTEYPVFETRFGKVGMMVCYDGFFPEVARELTNNGAEVIAWPVWGCNPMLAAARACENHVFLVSSTYTDPDADWTITAIYGRDGRPLARADKWGTIAIQEVDLGRPLHWQSLGDFRAQLPRHRPNTK